MIDKSTRSPKFLGSSGKKKPKMSALIKSDQPFDYSAYTSNRSEQVKINTINELKRNIKGPGIKNNDQPTSPAEKFTNLRPTITFAKVPTKRAAPIKKLDLKQTSPEKYLETESFHVTRLDTLGSLDETYKSKPHCHMK